MVALLVAVAIVGAGGIILYQAVIGEDFDPEEEARISRYHTLFNKGVLHLRERRYVEAIDTLESAERLFPGQLMAQYHLALARFIRRNAKGAMDLTRWGADGL